MTKEKNKIQKKKTNIVNNTRKQERDKNVINTVNDRRKRNKEERKRNEHRE